MKKISVDIVEILSTKKNWEKEFDTYYDHIKATIGTKECFNIVVDVKLQDKTVRLNVVEYVVNLIMWRPMVKFKMLPTVRTVMDCSCVTQQTISNFINNIYVRPLRAKVNINKLNLQLAKIIENLKLFVEDFGIIMGITYNNYQLIQLMKEQPIVRDLFYTKIPDGLQPKEIEVFAKERLEMLIGILKKSDTGFAPLLNSGVGVNPAQLQELLVVIANKPDLFGNTYPVPINTNIMIGGLDKPSHYTLDACAGHKALIMNKKYTGSLTTWGVSSLIAGKVESYKLLN